VPVFGAHSESLNVQTREPLGAAAARELLAAAPGVEVIDDPSHGRYPTPLDAEGKNPVYVGRIRDDDTAPNCLNFWVVADNLRKGAALNAVQIAEALVARGLL
jgi:aspartate-semialdehyde dehydrogenase